VQLARVPLGIATIAPASGASSAGATLAIGSSGFQAGMTATIGGKTAAVTVVDMNRLKNPCSRTDCGKVLHYPYQPRPRNCFTGR
jgi:hypothetical protein